MNTVTDSAELLRDYAATGAETAFAEVVRRHMDLVHSAALRRGGGNAALAAEVAQTVFTDLALKARGRRAREAGSVLAAASLAGWLYRHTCFVAATVARTESRRRTREETAMQLQAQSDSTDWSHVAPVLEEAMAELPDLDRDALVLSFFEKESFARVGATLGSSEDADGSPAVPPVERTPMQVHHGFEEEGVASQAVNEGVGKAAEVELAIVAVEHAPAVWLGYDPAQRGFKLVEEVASEAGLPFFVPEGGSGQLLVGFRMADDVHGAWRGCPGRCLQRGGS